MTPFACPVCKSALPEPIYSSAEGCSLDSLGRLLPFATKVHCCQVCSHVATEPIPDLDQYYAKNYRISLGSEDEDQLYEMVGGERVFRTDHQARLLIELLDWKPGTRVLDFGCAKASTLRKALPSLPDVELYLYDVSDDYRSHWDAFVPIERQAVRVLPQNWMHQFDVVTSLFSLEHIARLQHAMADIVSLLAPGGCLYLVVPDMFANPGDFVVLDHVNHFTEASLDHLLAKAGLTTRWIRSDVHRGALVALAGNEEGLRPGKEQYNRGDPYRLGRWWSQIAEHIHSVESECTGDAAIYGAGFYGSFILATLESPERLLCFLDNNPHLQGKEHLNVPVRSPRDCPSSVLDLWIGLNPLHAKRIMADVDLGDAVPRRIYLSEED